MLTTDSYLDILGHSIHSPQIVKIMGELQLSSPSEPNSFGESRTNNKANGSHFEFAEKNWYVREFGSPKSTFDDSDNELILQDITFDNDYSKTKKKFDISVPFNLQGGDNPECIITKLGKKPFEKSKSMSYDQLGYNYYFYKNQFKILVKLDDKLNLLWFRVWLINASEKYKIDLKKSLAGQNKNIKVENVPELIKQGEELPTKAWRKRMNDGDDIFTDKNISSSDKILSDFIENLIQATKEKKATKIHSAIKKVVLAFNRNSGFIETLEREEIVDFINNSVKLTGFQFDEKNDLTEQWREW